LTQPQARIRQKWRYGDATNCHISPHWGGKHILQASPSNQTCRRHAHGENISTGAKGGGGGEDVSRIALLQILPLHVLRRIINGNSRGGAVSNLGTGGEKEPGRLERHSKLRWGPDHMARRFGSLVVVPGPTVRGGGKNSREGDKGVSHVQLQWAGTLDPEVKQAPQGPLYRGRKGNGP